MNADLFTDFESVAKLRGHMVYTDTINILRSMLRKDNLEDKLDSYLKERDFLPESFFYQWLGSPENIILFDFKKDINEKNYN